ncbi:MAG: hypothetical protein ACXVAY_18090 [Mucilaginibacter sp.]
MNYFISNLLLRNPPLFYFGLVCLLSAIAFLSATKLSSIKVNGINAWYKPFKFALSIGIYCWTMGWFIYYLNLTIFQLSLFNYTVIVLLGFELFYIAFQAARGLLSHFNVSTPVYALLYRAMALAASAVTLYTAYIGVLFFKDSFDSLPDYYIWSIRFGIIIFVVFAFEGAVMGGRMAHTIGGPDGGDGLPLVNWSKKYGDGRIAHFVGMHAMQVLPFVSFFLFKNVLATFVLATLYAIMAIALLTNALKGKPLIKSNTLT